MGRLNICYQNVRGLRTKQENFYASLVDLVAYVVAIMETWLDEKHLDADLFPDVYCIFRADRVYSSILTHGGGSALAVWSGIECRRRRDLETFPETVWIKD